ncbi:MAG: neutral/alkaline non-lysosomal ceramidase N-terminal domain-containing protein [Candidatus Rokubacteria bacterium]|nr:neutral/alkaline non-lysosomal ceramidase N-terminal domain-containing protein [Candidatus Rokubacteria bacterium]
MSLSASALARAIVLALVLGAGAAPVDAAGLTAGAATVEIAVPPGTPLAGYGAAGRRALFPDLLGRRPHAFWFKSHEGQADPIAARALVLEHGGTRLVWIATDLIAVDRRLTAELGTRLERALGGPATLIVSASHTHSGPGAFADSEVMGFIAVERPDGAVRETILAALVDAARRANDRRAGARIGVAAAMAPDLTRSRLGKPIDRELVVMKVAAADGRPVALVWNFAIHPTMYGPRNLRLSGDVTGLASRALETALGVPALFVNGAVGDVSPRRHGGEAAREVAATLASAARAVWNRADPVGAAAPVTRTARVDLGAPSLSLRNCLGAWVPRALTIPVGAIFPADATLTAVAVGDAAWVTMPGELQAALGERVKRAAPGRWRHPFVAGLSNDYLGYFVGRAEFERVTYVTCASLYGPEAGERLAAAASALLRGLGNLQP